MNLDAKRSIESLNWYSEKMDEYRIDSLGDNTERLKWIKTQADAVQESFIFYFENVEKADWGSVGIYAVTAANGNEFLVVQTNTDGDEGFIEVFEVSGLRIASGVCFTHGEDSDGNPVSSINWDQQIGDVRQRIETQ
jgi:hypothetical protein